jgi:preprotein translocase subunit SecB
MVVLTVKLVNAEEKHAPYCGEVVVIGYFLVQPGSPKPEVLVAKTGAAMLYGAASEMITNITARGPWPAIQIQIVDFYKQTADQPGPVAADGR